MTWFSGFKRIVLSRFKNTEAEWVKERREICRVCPKNTNNTEKMPLRILIISNLSDLYTWVTGKEKTELGFCGICGCDLYYSTQTEEENCSDNPPKWKSIYTPNSAQNKKLK